MTARTHLTSLILVALLVTPTLAQRGVVDQLEQRLGPSAAQVAAEPTLARALGTQLRVRWDPATGCPSSVRFDPPVAIPSQAARSAEASAAWLLERVAPLYDGLPALGEAEGPWLELESQGGTGPHRHLVFRQRLGAAIVDASKLVLDFTCRDGQVFARGTSGRVWRGVPVAVTSIGEPPPAVRRVEGYQRVLTQLPDGVWKQAWSTVELLDLMATKVLRDAQGKVLGQQALGRHGFAEALVQGPAGGSQRLVRIPDLYVQAGERRVTTDAQGQFSGVEGRVPWGFAGPHERVMVRSGSYPRANRDGRLLLTPDAGGQQVTEASVFYHLAQLRRFVAGFLPASAWNKQVVALVHTNESINANAMPLGVTVEGRRFDYSLAFGFGTAEPSVVAHERGHAVLFALGLVETSGEGDSLHEGYADYLAAAYLGSPLIGAESISERGRNIDDDRIYPQNLGSSYHENSVIFSGALWDARRELGPQLDPIAFGAVGPGLASATMPEAAERVLELAPSQQTADVLRRHFVAHGLIRPGARPPVVEIQSDGQEVNGRLSPMGTEERRALTVEAYDPDGLGQTQSNLTFLLDGPGFARLGSAEDRLTGTGSRTLAVHRADLMLAPGPQDAGSYVLTLTAQNRVTGQTTVRTLHLTVEGNDLAREQWGRNQVLELEAQVGVRHTFPLRAEIPQLRDATAPYTYRFAGAVPSSLALVGENLVVQARPGEEGLHTFEIFAEPAGLNRNRDRMLSVPVELLVTSSDSGSGLINVFEPGPRGRLRVPPGQAVTVQAGEQVRLDVEGVFGASSNRDTRLTMLEGSALATFTGWSNRGDLTLHPADASRPTTATLTLELATPEGTVVARRELTVVVMPNLTEIELAPPVTKREQPVLEPLAREPSAPDQAKGPGLAPPLPATSARQGIVQVLGQVSDSIRGEAQAPESCSYCLAELLPGLDACGCCGTPRRR